MRRSVFAAAALVLAATGSPSARAQSVTEAYVITGYGPSTLTAVDLLAGTVRPTPTPLGAVPNAVKLRGDSAYVVESGAFPTGAGAGIRVVGLTNRTTARTIGLPDGSNPWDLAFVERDGATRLYVSLYGTNEVVRLTPGGAVAARIPVRSAPENLLYVQPYLYVANAGPYTGYDSTVTVIDTRTDAVVTTIPVGLNPQALSVAGGNLYVVSTGDYFSTGAALTVIDLKTNARLRTVSLTGTPAAVSLPTANGRLFVGNGQVYDTVLGQLLSGVRGQPTTVFGGTRVYSSTSTKLAVYSQTGDSLRAFELGDVAQAVGLRTATTPAPVVLAGPNPTISTSPFSDRILVFAADGRSVPISKTGGPDWLTVSPDGFISGTVPASAAGGSVTVQLAAPGVDPSALSFTLQIPAGLPVELTGFAARPVGGAVELTWTTATETNNAGFSVQRATGSAWTELGFVAGHGTTVEAQAYRYTDRTATGVVRYRLVQRDLDGTEAVGPTVEVTMTAPTTFALLPAMPNPFNPTTTIGYHLAAAGQVGLELFDALGRRVRTLVDEPQPAGAYTVTLDGSGLASGVYLVRLAVGSRVQTRRITLVR